MTRHAQTLGYASYAPPRVNPWLHRFAVLLAVCSFFLIIAGGMVTSTGSGLSVPDWPTTYGQNMFTYPYSKWVGGIFYEHSHRLIASTVGFLTIILAVWLSRVEPRRWMRRLGWIALAAVILQGILGGLTVRYLLPAPISVFHACLAQSFFCLSVGIAVFTSPSWRRPTVKIETPTTLAVPRLCVALVSIVFLQLLLGAIMRHTESGLAVPDFPKSYGQWLPDLDHAAVEQYNYDRRWTWQLDQITVDQIVWHMLHRVGAVLVTLVLAIMAMTVLSRHAAVAPLRRPAVIALFLLAVQIALGAWTVWSAKAPRITTAHVAIGAALLADTLLLALMAHRHLCVTRTDALPASTLEGVPA